MLGKRWAPGGRAPAALGWGGISKRVVILGFFPDVGIVLSLCAIPSDLGSPDSMDVHEMDLAADEPARPLGESCFLGVPMLL